MNIGELIRERTDRAGIQIEDIPDKGMIDALVIAAVVEITKDTATTNDIITMCCGLAGACYKLGLTANRDTALEAGTKLLEELNEK